MKIGLIAGNGSFPVRLIDYCTRQELEIVVVKIKDHHQISANLIPSIELPIGQVKRVVSFFKAHHVSHVVFLGGINRQILNRQLSGGDISALASYFRLWQSIRPDCQILKIIRRVGLRDDSILRGFATFFEGKGFSVIGASEVMKDLVVRTGDYGKSQELTASVKRDISVGLQAATRLGELDIAQSVVVSGGVVVAVEAIEGTDAMIERAGRLLCGQPAVLVKLPKPQQDKRLDLPAVGEQTLKGMAESGISVLVLQNGGAMVDNLDFYNRAEQLGITIIVRDSFA